MTTLLLALTATLTIGSGVGMLAVNALRFWQANRAETGPDMLTGEPLRRIMDRGDEPEYVPGDCSVSFSPVDVDAYVASRPYTDAGIGSGSPMHDTDELMDFHAWLSQKQNAENQALTRERQ